MRVAFLWINGTKPRETGQWNDGLAAAMRIVGEHHEVSYHDQNSTTWEDADVLILWEAPCTARGQYADFYNKVRNSSKKKILLFAGGPIDLLDAVGFDLYLVESEINEREFEALGLPWMRAFGVNTQVMKPMVREKKYQAFMQATFAEWKRHSLFANAMGVGGCVAGRLQENDRQGYYDSRDRGVTIFEEQMPDKIAELINESHVVLNTASYWGGGQRCTLEAMACGIPVIVMSDSPKNSEYVLESGAGVICEPSPEAIRAAFEEAKTKTGGYDYVQNKWTDRHYADNILKAISSLYLN
jgi:glycosyltransferase involved in cell wall biosynthesis